MAQTTGIFDLATRAATRAIASWQALTGVQPAALTPPSASETAPPATDDRRAA